MAGQIGKCPLCLNARELQESYLLPRAVYKLSRDTSQNNPHPVLFSALDERQSARQARKTLLCSDCEQRFHRLGEDWVLEHCARTPQIFKMRDLMLEHNGDKLADDVFCFYSDRIPAIDADALCYFCYFDDLAQSGNFLDHRREIARSERTLSAMLASRRTPPFGSAFRL